MVDETLATLRARLDQADEEILRLAKRRLDIVQQIHEVKQREGVNLFDRSREQSMFRRVEKIAETLHLDKAVARKILSTLLDASHAFQEERARLSPSPAGTVQQKFLIIGGAGKMGQLFTRTFRERGFQVKILEKGDAIGGELIREADIILLAVPMEAATQVAEAISPLVRQDALLCDINSLKEEICDVFRERCPGETLGLHPMFGPTVRSFRRQKVVLCPVRSGNRSAWFRTELGRMGFELIETEPKQHDRMMALIQVLIHFSTIVTGEALKRTGVPVEDTLPFTSPIYRLELTTIGRLFAQEPELYAEIEMRNPWSDEVLRHFVDAAEDLRKLVVEKNRKAFSDQFRTIRGYFSGFSEEAMNLSDMIIETLTEES